MLCIVLGTCSMMLFLNQVVPTWHKFTEYNNNAQTWSLSTHSHQTTLLLPFKTGPDCATTLCVSNTRSFQLQLRGSLRDLAKHTPVVHQLRIAKGCFSWGSWLYTKIYSSSKCIFYRIQWLLGRVKAYSFEYKVTESVRYLYLTPHNLKIFCSSMRQNHFTDHLGHIFGVAETFIKCPQDIIPLHVNPHWLMKLHF